MPTIQLKRLVRLRNAMLRALTGSVLIAALTACERAGDNSTNAQPEALPALGARIDRTSTSGISSGAYMAGQFQIAHGRDVIGAAIIAGGPYGCAESTFSDVAIGPAAAVLNVARAINGCMLNALQPWGIPDPDQLADRAGQLAQAGKIDPIETVADDRVYLYSANRDSTVVGPIVAAAAAFYARLGVKPEAIALTEAGAGGHAFITENAGLACGESGSPYLNDCDFDQAGALLSHIYGPLQARSEVTSGRLVAFDQTPFTRDLADHGMAATGMAYIPIACTQTAGCAIHIAYHGCNQNREKVGEAFVTGTGFAPWADANRLIVLFPEIRVTTINPYGCWDWWGYTGREYLTRQAPQIIAVKRMIDQLSAAP